MTPRSRRPTTRSTQPMRLKIGRWDGELIRKLTLALPGGQHKPRSGNLQLPIRAEQPVNQRMAHSSHSKKVWLQLPPLSRHWSTRTSRMMNGVRVRLAARANSTHDTTPMRGNLPRALNVPIAPNRAAPDKSRDDNALRSYPSLCGPGGPPATHPLKNASFKKNNIVTTKIARTIHRAILGMAKMYGM